ncbi:MAG: Fic family protein, partial [Streptococcus sp.]
DRAEYMELLAAQNIQGLANLLQQSLDDEKERMSQF